MKIVAVVAAVTAVVVAVVAVAAAVAAAMAAAVAAVMAAAAADVIDRRLALVADVLDGRSRIRRLERRGISTSASHGHRHLSSSPSQDGTPARANSLLPTGRTG